MVTTGRSGTLKQIWKAIGQLNPVRTVREAEKPFTLAIVGSSEQEISEVRKSLLGPSPSSQDVVCSAKVISAYLQPFDTGKIRQVRKHTIVIAIKGAEANLTDYFTFDLNSPGEAIVKAIADDRRYQDFKLALAKCLPAFRLEIARSLIREVSLENAVFVITTALGNVIPSVIQPLIGIAEAAGDTVFLTANQIRMLFTIGSIYNVKVGYTAQWQEISSIIGAAFGWRSLARNLVSKIPFGGGLIPKGAVAYAGTMAVGEGVIFFYRTGRRMTRQEVSEAFRKAYSDAVGTVRSLVDKFRSGDNR